VDRLLHGQSRNLPAQLANLGAAELIAPCPLGTHQQRKGTVGSFSGGDLRDGRLDRALHAVACSERCTGLLIEGCTGKPLHRLSVVHLCLAGDCHAHRHLSRLTADRVIGAHSGMTLCWACQLLARTYLLLQARLRRLGEGGTHWSGDGSTSCRATMV
jgi:hypothetical protein